MRRKLITPLLVATVLLSACGPVDNILAGLDAAPPIIQATSLDQSVKDRLIMGFAKEARIFRVFKASDRGQEAKEKAIFDTIENIRVNFAPTNNQSVDVWISAIILSVKSFLGIPPDDGFEASKARAPRAVKITDEDAKKFRALIEKGPQ